MAQRRVALLLLAAVVAGVIELTTARVEKGECDSVHTIPHLATRRAALVNHTRRYCESASASSVSAVDGPIRRVILFNSRHKMAYASLEKVMSTSMLKLFVALKEGWEDPTNKTRGEVRSASVDHVPLHASTKSWVTRFEKYHRIMFVRNPYSRLYSAWTHKFYRRAEYCGSDGRTSPVQNADCPIWHTMAQKIHKHLGFVCPERVFDAIRGVTWPMFLRAVLDGVAVNSHWESQVRTTNLCAFAPTFMGTVEHGPADLQALLDELGLSTWKGLTADMFEMNISERSSKIAGIDVSATAPMPAPARGPARFHVPATRARGEAVDGPVREPASVPAPVSAVPGASLQYRVGSPSSPWPGAGRLRQDRHAASATVSVSARTRGHRRGLGEAGDGDAIRAEEEGRGRAQVDHVQAAAEAIGEAGGDEASAALVAAAWAVVYDAEEGTPTRLARALEEEGEGGEAAPVPSLTRLRPDFAQLYPAGLKERVDKHYKQDFLAFAYVMDPACVYA